MMAQSYTYLLINFLTIVICFAASFHQKIRFDRYFGVFLLSSTVVALPFIVWDAWFTRIGVWWFNHDYTLGVDIAGLPLEECLFFFCIPFACVFTYYCLNKFFDLSWANAFNNILVFAAFVFLAVIALINPDRLYTLVTAVVTITVLLYLHLIRKKTWIGQASLVYLLLMPGFFMVNGVLTGTGISAAVVNYNPTEHLGIRMLTIPVEDAVYGYSLFLLNLYFFERFRVGLSSDNF